MWLTDGVSVCVWWALTGREVRRFFKALKAAVSASNARWKFDEDIEGTLKNIK